MEVPDSTEPIPHFENVAAISKSHRIPEQIQDNTFDNHRFIYRITPTGVEIAPETSERTAMVVRIAPDASGEATTTIGITPEASGGAVTVVGIAPEASGAMATVVGIVSEAFR